MVTSKGSSRSAQRWLALLSVAALTSLVGAPAFAATTVPATIISPGEPASQIESAISSNAAVEFEPGNYAGVDVNITKADSAAEMITFAAGSVNYSGLTFTVDANGVTFESANAGSPATFSGGSGPIFTLGDNAMGTTITALDFTGIDDPTFSGVVTVPGTGVSSVTVSDNTFNDLQDTAIGYHGNASAKGTGWMISGNTISNLTGGSATNGPSGIWLGNLSGSTISGNTISHSSWAGILLTGGSGLLSEITHLGATQTASTDQNNKVSGNIISNVAHEGIQVGFGSDITIDNNQVSKAGQSNNNGRNNRDGAISLFNPNQINITIENNRLLDSYQGVTVGQTGFTAAALGSGITVTGNTIEGNTNAGIGNYAASGTVNAEDNWWGKGVTPSVTGSVTASPYLASMTLALSDTDVTPGASVTATATILENTGASVLSVPFVPVDYQVYLSGSTTPVASGSALLGQAFTLPSTLAAGTYTVVANAAIGGQPSANLSATTALTVASVTTSTPPATPPPVVAQGSTSPASGGSVQAQSANGTTVNVSVPAESFSVPVQLTVNAASTVPSNVQTLANLLQVLTVTATTSSGASEHYPSKPVLLTFQLTSPPTSPVTVQFWNALLGAWQPLPGVSVNGTTVTVSVSHFTTFALVPWTAVSSVQRLGGATRMDTSLDAAEAAYPDGATSAILANAGTGTASPDALAAAGLAGALHAPILLNPAGALDSNVAAGLTALGVKTVYVVGGPAAISDAVVASLQNMGLTVVRDFEGATRFQTAELIDAYMYTNHLTTSTTLFVANGATMVDALSASPVAYSQGDPLLLVNTGQTSLTASEIAAMQQAGIKNVVILGQTQAVAPGIETQLASAFGASSVIRLGGANRDETAVAIDQHFFPNPAGVIVSGDGSGGGSFVDALSASALASMNDVPIVLSTPTGLPTATQTYLKQISPQTAWVMGGTAALSTNVSAQVTGDLAQPQS